jgi:hypothetical protein
MTVGHDAVTSFYVSFDEHAAVGNLANLHALSLDRVVVVNDPHVIAARPVA